MDETPANQQTLPARPPAPDAALTPAWVSQLRGNPLPWLLDRDTPAVRHLALRELLGRWAGDPQLREAQAAAMATAPIAAILAAQDPEGFWLKPGAGYAPKYRGTVWSLVFLDQLGADPADPRVQRACEYVLTHTQASNGGFGASGSKEENVPPPSRVVHCLNGNILRALLGFGRAEDPRVQHAIDWQARAITGHGFDGYYRSGTSGPLFRCVANEGLPCAWGAIEALGGLVRVPPALAGPAVAEAICAAAEFLLSRDPAVADYPMGYGNTRPNRSWFKLGFPMGYVADVLRNLQVLCEAGYAHDPRLRAAAEWVLDRQDAQGRWKNEYAYHGKTYVDFEQQGASSKWVTLRACRVVKAVFS